MEAPNPFQQEPRVRGWLRRVQCLCTPKFYAVVFGLALSNISTVLCYFMFMPRSRTSLAAFVALELLSHDQWHHAGETWQACVLRPRCIIIDPKGQHALVVACQVHAARIWPLCKDGDSMLLDPSLPMEWVVCTNITAWRVVPWEPVVAFDRDASHSRYGCVSFKQSRPEVPALAWAVANHRLRSQQLRRFVKDHNADDAEDLLERLLADHEDHAYYMTVFHRGKVKEDPPADLAEITKACFAELDPDNLKQFNKERQQLIGPQLGDDFAVGSDDEQPVLPQEDDTKGSGDEEKHDTAADIQLHEPVEATQLEGEANLGPPTLDLEALGESRPERACPVDRGMGRAKGVHSSVEWANRWLPPAPPDATKFGFSRISAGSKWTAFYNHPDVGLPRAQATHTGVGRGCCLCCVAHLAIPV